MYEVVTLSPCASAIFFSPELRLTRFEPFRAGLPACPHSPRVTGWPGVGMTLLFQHYASFAKERGWILVRDHASLLAAHRFGGRGSNPGWWVLQAGYWAHDAVGAPAEGTRDGGRGSIQLVGGTRHYLNSLADLGGVLELLKAHRHAGP